MTRVRRIAIALALLLPLMAAAAPAAAGTPDTAATPPMGWATWYGLRCHYDAATLRTMADRMVTLGLAAAGYNHLNVDDCWATGRDAADALVADPARFPGGLHPVAEYVHARGLRFGLYTSAGTTTCQRELQADASRLPIGSRGHEAADMRQFAAIGADFVKVDWCGRYDTQDSRSSYETFRDAIAATRRPMLLSICDWGYGKPWLWGRGVGAMWRIAMDTLNCWACRTDWGGLGVVDTFDRLAAVSTQGGPHGWNDPDVLMIGNGILSADEERAQISVYAMAAAPLIAAADLRTIPRGSLAVLTHRGVIAIDQDPLGKPGQRIRQEDGEEIWVRDLSGGRRAVLLFNRSSLKRPITLKWSELDLTPGTQIGGGRELWSGDTVRAGDGVSRLLPPHGVALFVLDPPSTGGTVRAPI